MAKTKISEYSATANSNTDIGGINVDEGCAPSGINDAIRTLMAQLKNFQTGTGGDSFNGPVGTTTAAAGAFTTLSATGNVTLGDASTDTLNVGNGGLVKDASGNVGVGTSTLLTKFTIQDTERFEFGGASGVMYSQALNAARTATVENRALGSFISWWTGASGSQAEKLRLDASGNLGLGVTPSAWYTGGGFKALQIGARTSLTDDSGNNNLRLMFNAYYNSAGSPRYLAAAAATSYLQSAGTHQWYNAPAGANAGDAITFTQAMTLDASGNLLLGTTSALGFNLHVAAPSGSSPKIGLTSTSWRSWAIKVGASPADPALIFSDESASAERARIDSSGNLLVGKTATDGTKGTTAGIEMLPTGVGIFTVTSNEAGLFCRKTTDGTVVLFRRDTATVGSVSVTTTATTYNTSSDYRLKDVTGVVTGEEAKTFIMALQPKQGTWKSDGSKFVGFLAHEFQEVSPTSVTGEKDAVDENGNPKYQGMQASSPEVMANLIALVQEQQALITQLQADVAALKA